MEANAKTITVGSKIGPVTHYRPDCPELRADLIAGHRLCAEGVLGWLCTECVEVPTTPLWQNPSVDPEDFATPAMPEGTGTGSGGRRTAPMGAVVELTDEEAETLTASIAERADRKFTVEEITPELVALATRYAKSYEGSFEFMVDMREAATVRGLTAGQAKGTLNCLLAEIRRNGRAAAPAPESALDLSELLPGMYAVPAGSTRLKVRVSHGGDAGRWAGFIFVNDGAEYGAGTRYGMQKPGEMYRGQIEDELRAILADPKAASAAYGQLVGRCGVCGRRLEDEDSVARGIGPVCAERF